MKIGPGFILAVGIPALAWYWYDWRLALLLWLTGLHASYTVAKYLLSVKRKETNE